MAAGPAEQRSSASGAGSLGRQRYPRRTERNGVRPYFQNCKWGLTPN
jgi:hypothetical protein